MDEPVELAELSDDIEVVGPGQMLAEARQSLGLSVDDVAQRLNFTQTLVKDIEADKYKPNLPETFIRGYLKNYAKLVHIAEKDILVSYEMLGVAQQQGAEMQSFSRITEKHAENNRLMWLSYFILALLIGLTVLWWLQDVPSSKTLDEPTVTAPSSELKATKPAKDSAQRAELESEFSPNVNDTDEVDMLADEAASHTELPQPEPMAAESLDEPMLEQSLPLTNVSTLVFTFSGDCWVNIYDSTGEHVAWGIKKSGYVMTIQGQPPFSITLGKPELVTIAFDQQAVDMSKFSAGNIAKFSLPLKP